MDEAQPERLTQSPIDGDGVQPSMQLVKNDVSNTQLPNTRQPVGVHGT